MEESLLCRSEEKKERWDGSGFLKELKKLSYIGAPMVAVSVSEYLLRVVSVMMAGHLGQLSLSGIAMAVSFTNVTGFSLLFGLAGALETLCGQAYGAKQYHKLGTYTYCEMIFLVSICVPISILWIFLDKVLIFVGQDPLISIVACRFAIGLIPALFGYAVLQSLIPYLQS
ncbi:hypothetical protein HS088_TW03G00358 [Tripterygium wilfordii]|uniref:Uncharacterized protein n=1 Tax=Tripterygium wilfordii TaxID=458696 RepID=A0A7J7DUR4_TRIWF|nr:hypothetical protein HS088_TW03G00358 [Tripterygium wilfordii]